MIRGRNAQIRQSKAVCSLEPGWFLVLERVSQMSRGPFKRGMARHVGMVSAQTEF